VPHFCLASLPGYTSIPVAILLGLISRRNSYDRHTRFENPPGPSLKNGAVIEIIALVIQTTGENSSRSGGSGLAGGSRRGHFGRLGYRVEMLLFFRIRRGRAHSIAAQGGINAAKNYQNDGDSVIVVP